MRRLWMVLAIGALFAVSRPVAADVWDVQGDSDNGTGTDNDLVHGTSQLHDLAALPGPLADNDWYKMDNQGRSSYEAVVDGTSGDIGSTVVFERTDSAGTLPGIQTSVPASHWGYSRSLRWINSTATSAFQLLHVISGSCSTTCGADDQYSIRFYETTYNIPRFNNSASQVTVLQIQNPTPSLVNLEIHFWAVNGTFLGTQTTAVPARGLLVLNTAGLGFAAGQSGSITVANTAGYGALSGKTVALEPSTGFTFDTLMTPRAN